METKFIALVGESPNDTYPIRALLSQRFSPPHFRIASLFDDSRHKDLKGSKLDEKKGRGKGKFGRILRIEFELQQPDVVILIRDLDALKSDKEALRLRNEGFTKFNQRVDRKGIFLLNIYELEALIWADIESFNHQKGTNIAPVADPMMLPAPKEALQKHTNYIEADCHDIFPLLRIDVVAANCRYFADFLKKFEQRLA